jgi:tellurite resistance protein TerC
VETIGTWWMWVAFVAVVLVMLAIDLFVVGGGKQHKVGFKEAASWSLVWVAVSLSLCRRALVVSRRRDGARAGQRKVLEFVTGYLIEKSLAVDNVFVWLMLFGFFAVPLELQKRVLVYGVLGAIVMRTVMIFAGVWLIAKFHWILYVFGAFLLITGIKMWWFADEKPDLANNPVIRWLRGHMKVTDELHGERFFVMKQEAGTWVRYATPLFLVLVLVEISDLIFAVDSIPAIFAITTDPFIVLTSNVFAILGLRAMYFLLADMADRFSLLKYGLALVLIFIGAKMMLIDLQDPGNGFARRRGPDHIHLGRAFACGGRPQSKPSTPAVMAGAGGIPGAGALLVLTAGAVLVCPGGQCAVPALDASGLAAAHASRSAWLDGLGPPA